MMKIQLKLNGKVISATLADTPVALEFVAMLPLTITMHDLFRREKFGPLPGHAASVGTRTRTRTRTAAYDVGDIICWAPGPDLAVFHRHDGQKITGAFHMLGKLDSGADEFAAPGPLEVTFETQDCAPEPFRPVPAPRSAGRGCDHGSAAHRRPAAAPRHARRREDSA